MTDEAPAGADTGLSAGAENKIEKLPRGIIRIAPNMTMTDPALFPEGDLYDARVFRSGVEVRLILSSQYVCDPSRWDTLKQHASEHQSNTMHVMLSRPWEFEDRYSPWETEGWWRLNQHIWQEHAPVGSEKHPGLLSYYQDPIKRVADIRTPIKPGRYLKKYFSHLLSEQEIRQCAIKWEEAFSPRELKVTQDADEIESVYEHGPSSCMAGGDGNFSGYCHPSRVYAGPDLGIAYIGPKDAAAKERDRRTSDAHGAAVERRQRMNRIEGYVPVPFTFDGDDA